ncbi:putative catechol O-methyltransferase 2 [Paramyrothecium foliicola]|nr:putative catechol O-methyltransferase 2 [Paramyrothecium foliicola]
MGASLNSTVHHERKTMAPFDQERAYAEQGDVFFDDGREIELLHFVYSRPNIGEIRGSPKNVLAAIDEYARTKKYLMNVGEMKGKIVTDLILESKPKTMVELGGYVGYSCILFADALRQAGGKRYYTLERNPEFAAVILSLVDLAGLSDMVKVVVGPSDEALRRLHGQGLQRIDLMFLDHYKPAYVTDLKLCEELGLVGPGSVLAADNVIKPGNPPYLEYVRSSVEDKQAKLRGGSETANGVGNGFGRYARQYEKREGEEVLNTALKGNPDLVYQTRLVESFEPSGVPEAPTFGAGANTFGRMRSKSHDA